MHPHWLDIPRPIVLASSADIVRGYITPVVSGLCIAASLACALFLIIGGYHYIASSGNPSNLAHAKKVIKNALIGLVIILAAASLSGLLSHAYGSPSSSGLGPNVPTLNAIKPQSSSGLIDIILKTMTGVLGSIVEMVAIPFLKALTYFTSGTPLVAANPSVFNLWLSVVGMADALFVVVVILLGFHVMSFASIGLEDINLKQLLPRIGLAFLLINSSLFIIDSLISLSNLMIKAINGNQSVTSVWSVLEEVLKKPSAYDLAALIIMVIFLVFSVILLVYYVSRIVVLYLGAVLAPLIFLCWLLPSLRDFALTASKRYITTIFVLFVHVVILELAGSLLAGMISGGKSNPDPLMAMIVGLATLVALLKTQGVMAELSMAAVGPRTARKIGERLVLSLSYLGSQTGQAASQLLPARIPYNQQRLEPSSYHGLGSIPAGDRTSSTSASAKKTTTAPPKVDPKGLQKS